MYRGNVKLAGEARPGSATYEEYCRSAHFDGVDDFAEVAYDKRFHGEDFTVEAWVKLDHVPRDYGSVVTSRQAPQRTAGYAIYISPEGQWEFWTGNNGDWSVLEGS